MKIKKPFKIMIIALGIITSILILVFISNTLKFYRVPTPSNEPTIMQGAYILSTNLKKPNRFDFICYNFDDQISKAIFVKRLCGLPGDTLEIRKGDLFVNNKSVDHLFSLYHKYFISPPNLEDLLKTSFDKKNIIEGPNLEFNDGDTVFTVLLSKEWVLDKNINAVRSIMAINTNEGTLSDEFNKSWNIDNFGPIVIPEKKYFVLGDSRENTLDSRHSGYIDESDLIGTVLKNWTF